MGGIAGIMNRTCADIVSISETCALCSDILIDISNSRRGQKHGQFSQCFW